MTNYHLTLDDAKTIYIYFLVRFLYFQFFFLGSGKCFKEAEHFWPLDRIHVNTFVHDLIGFKDGTFTNGTIVKGAWVQHFHHFSFVDSQRQRPCDWPWGLFWQLYWRLYTMSKRITISFWVQFQYVKTGDVLYTSGRHEGVSIAFSEDTSELTITIFSYNETLKISAKMTKTVWYHVFVAARKGTIPWMIINGAEVFWGTVEAFYPAGESNSHFVVGKQQTVGTSLTFRINQLVIWTKALSMTEMKRVFNCAGIQPGKFLHRSNFFMTKLNVTFKFSLRCVD